MPGDDWQKLANLRALYAYMWAHPGKKLLFMGGELAQEQEWSHERSLDWHLLERPATPASSARARPQPPLPRDAGAVGARRRARRLPLARRRRPRRQRGRLRPLRRATAARRWSPPRTCRRSRATATASALPRPGRWREVLNTDAEAYGGANVGNLGGVGAEDVPWHDQPALGRGDGPSARGGLAHAG